MAIGTTAAVDPTTGERTESQFNYTPVDPNDELMRKAYEAQIAALNPPPPQPRGPTPYWENPETYYPQQAPQINPIEQAKAATAAAYKYIALRGYQQDLKNGSSAADAFAKWGPMLVQDTSFAPALKALQPQPAYQYDDKTRTWLQKDASGRIVGKPVMDTRKVPGQVQVVPPKDNIPGYAIDPNGGMHVFPQPSAPKIDPLTLSDYKNAETDFNKALKVYQNSDETEAMRLDAAKRMEAAKVRMRNIRSTVLPTAQPTAAPAVPTPAPAAPAQAAAPQKREGFPFAPMEKSKRVNGQIYSVPVSKSTPNGIAVWTTAGWIPQ